MSNNREGTSRDLTRANTKAREKRRAEAEKGWRRNPIEKFESQKNKTRMDRDVKQLKGKVERFERYLLDEIAPESEVEIIGVRDAVREDIEEYRDEELKSDGNLGNSTIADYLAYLRQFYNILSEHNAFVGNPVKKPLQDFRNNHDLDVGRPYIPYNRMRAFLNWLTFPFSRAFWLAGLKHGTRMSETINIDLRCLHIDHPVFWEIIDNHDVQLDPRIRDLPDTILIYEGFNKGAEIPNEGTPGPETEGEIRDKAQGNKRSEEGGSTLPLDSEFKTALIDWLMVRPPTYGQSVNSLFVVGGSRTVRRAGDVTIQKKLWRKQNYADSILHFAVEEEISECPTCGGSVVEENPSSGDKTGRRFRCRNCRQNHWRSIYWDTDLDTAQKMGFHVARHYFTNLHDPGKTDLHDGAIPDKVRKKRIRGDSKQNGDTEDNTYKDKSYESYDADVREPYLNGIAKFDIYDEVIPAVGEGWEQ